MRSLRVYIILHTFHRGYYSKALLKFFSACELHVAISIVCIRFSVPIKCMQMTLIRYRWLLSISTN